MKKLITVLLLLLTITIGATACKKNTEFDITFVVDGVAIKSLDIVKGETLPEIVAPTKEGHTFSGWYLDEGFNTRFIATSKIESNITVYAKFTPNIYDITFVAEGSSNIIKKVAYGTALTDIPPVPVKEGFSGAWNTTIFTNIKENRTITAVYTHNPLTITFRAEGIDDIIREVAYGSTLTDIPVAPAKIGKECIWEDKDYTNITQSFVVNGTYSDIILEVTFVSALGDEAFEETVFVSYGHNLSNNDRPQQPRAFEGHTGVWESAIYDNITKSFVVNAIYTPFYYLIRFYNNDTIVFEESVPYGTILSTYIAQSTTLSQEEKDALLVEEELKKNFAPEITSDPRNRNYRYSNTDTDINTPIKEIQNLYLGYDQIVYVSFNLNGGTFQNSIPLNGEGKYELNFGGVLPNITQKDRYGYEFVGWFYDEEEEMPFYIYDAINNDIAIYAIWKELFCQITFPELDGITFRHNYIEPIKYGESFSFEVFSEENILEIKANATSLSPNDYVYTLEKVEEDINLAVRTDKIEIFMLEFQNSQYDTLFTRSVSKNLSLQAVPEVPKVTGAIGVWKVEDEEFDFDTPIKKDIILVSDYTYLDYSITYNLGEKIEYGHITYGNTAFEFLSPARKDGELFDGWYKNSSFDGDRVTREYLAYLGKSVALFPRWIAEKTIDSEIVGIWFVEGLVVQFHSNGMVQISDAVSFSSGQRTTKYLECHFDITNGTINIFEEIATFDGTNLTFRNQILTKTTSSAVTIIEFENIEFMDGTNVLTVEGTIIPQREEFANWYWFTDLALTQNFDITQPIDLSNIKNNTLYLYRSNAKRIRLNYNSGEGSMSGNITVQDIGVNAYDFSAEELLQPLPVAGKNFVGWVLEGTTTVVDKAFLLASSGFVYSLVAVYIDDSHSPEQSFEGEYSVVNGDEIIIVNFDANGTYQLIFIDTVTNTYTKNIPNLYFGSELDGFTDENDKPIEKIDDSSISIYISNEIVTLYKRELELPSDARNYKRTLESEEIQRIEFNTYQIAIDNICIVDAYQKGDSFYYFIEISGILILQYIDITTLEEVIIPEIYVGEYEGVANYGDVSLVFIMVIDANGNGTVAFLVENMLPMDITISIEDNDRCRILLLEWILFFEDEGYQVESNLPEVSMAITLTKIS